MTLILEHLTAQRRGSSAITCLSLTVAPSECFVLFGTRGSGTSHLLRLLTGHAPVDQGRVLLNGQDITHLPAARRTVRLVCPHQRMGRHDTVGRAIMATVSRHARDAAFPQQYAALLEWLGLTGMETHLISRLSPGYRLRVLLARALIARSDLLLLDDPFQTLDSFERAELRRLVRHLQHELGMTTIVATHEREDAFELADRLGVLHQGRLLEVGSVEELYQRPQTEVVATLLGPANLLVGECTDQGIRVGPFCFALHPAAEQPDLPLRVQVLFRPEDVVLATSAERLSGGPLGQAQVVSRRFAGTYERLWLRLTPFHGVRSIAPTVPFGESGIWIEALRSLDQAHHLPLNPADTVWVGVRRVHALSHPGLRLLILSDGSPGTQAAVSVGTLLAQQTQARAALLGYGAAARRLQRSLDAVDAQPIGATRLPPLRVTHDLPATAVIQAQQEQPCDLVVLGYQSSADLELAAHLLSSGEQHLLLVPRPQALPTRILICVAGGEPAKATIRFAGRLLRHWSAHAVLLSVLPTHTSLSGQHDQRAGFLAAGINTLATLGVPAQPLLRTGDIVEQIATTMRAERCDMVVVGASTSCWRSLGLTGQIVQQVRPNPVLIVRSPAAVLQPERHTSNIVTSLVADLIA